MEHLNRDLQRRLLTGLADAYPGIVEPSSLGLEAGHRDWVVNISYLAEHNLVEAHTSDLIGATPVVLFAKATARGMDFLLDDGGLSAILGMVTVRFEAETLKALIGAHVDASALPEPEKSRIKTWLMAAGSEALKETTKRLVAAALEHAPEAFQLLQTLRG
jgi:hypothetical protein